MGIKFKQDGAEFDFEPLPGMTQAEIDELLPEARGTKKVWTAKEVADKFRAVDIKAWAKEQGLKSTGTEVSVAQALLDVGFNFEGKIK